MPKIMQQNMIQLLHCFILEAIYIIATGDGEIQENSEYYFRELEEMAQVVKSLFEEREGCYTNYEIEADIVRYVAIFADICSIPKRRGFNYEDVTTVLF